MLIRRHPACPRRWLILLVLLAALPLPSGVAARPNQQLSGFGRCSIAAGDAWFVEEISFEPLTIAPGAAVEPTTAGDQDGAGSFARIANTTSTPLYLVEVFSDYGFQEGYAAATPISLEADLIVKQRVVFSTAEHWAWSGRPTKAGWHSAGAEAIYIYADHSQGMQVLRGYRSEQHWGDDRPADVAIPQPLTYTLSVIYGREVFDIPVIQSYSLNPHYDPDKGRNEQAKCPSWGENLIQTPLALLTMAGQLVRWCFALMMLILATALLVVLGSAVRRRVRGRS